MDDVLVGKVNISARLKKIYFPKISEQAPLNCVKNNQCHIVCHVKCIHRYEIFAGRTTIIYVYVC